MKVPESPPDLITLLTALTPLTAEHFVRISQIHAVDAKDRYLHWEQTKHRPLPEGFTREEYWLGTKLARRATEKVLPFLDKAGCSFTFSTPDTILSMLHEIDRDGIGYMPMNAPIATGPARDMYLVRSLIEEAISSSQLEGASTSRKVAKAMILADRPPRNRSEQMILNNYHAMHFVREQHHLPLSIDTILELHRITTLQTLDDPDDAGRLRSRHDDVRVFNVADNQTLHIPPHADELPERLARLCAFANEETTATFIHPVIRAILLHFILAYDHPFVDGNGRTARALFYWSALNAGYWLLEFTSISKIIKNAPVQYGNAFLYTETDTNDTTYFILHQLGVIRHAIRELHEYLQRKANEFRAATTVLTQSRLQEKFNHRQIALLEHALKNPGAIYQFKEHQNLHNISYQTARTDLLSLVDDPPLLLQVKRGKSFVFLAPADLHVRISKFGEKT